MKSIYYSLVFLVALVLGGCGQQLNEITANGFGEIAQTYGPENTLAMQQLDTLVMQGEAAIAEAKPYLTDENPQTRWLAVYVIGRVSNHDTVALLLPLLEDDNEVVRISAAGTLANKGYKEALPVLAAAVDSASVIEYLHPQGDIASFSQEVLSAYTSQSFLTIAEWQQWWNNNQAALQWNSEQNKYTVGQ